MGNGEAAPDEGGKYNTSEDQIIGSIGEWGRWQAKWFLVLCFVALPSGFPRDCWKKRSLDVKIQSKLYYLDPFCCEKDLKMI